MAQRFNAVIESENPANTMTFIEVPARIIGALGPRKRVPVRVTINGYTYRSTTAVYGGRFYLPVRAEVRQGAGIAAGDRVTIELALDNAPRTVEPPQDLANALRAARLVDAFARLAPSHQKEYVQWFESAKRPQTRVSRIEKIVEAVREKGARR